MSLACSPCIADPEACPLLAADRSNEPRKRPDQSEHTGLRGRGGRSSNKPFRTESEYTYFTEMLYEKPMWVWKIAQHKSILVDLNNGIMISRNGHDMGPLRFYSSACDLTMYAGRNQHKKLSYVQIWIHREPLSRLRIIKQSQRVDKLNNLVMKCRARKAAHRQTERVQLTWSLVFDEEQLKALLESVLIHIELHLHPERGTEIRAGTKIGREEMIKEIKQPLL